MGKKDAEKSAPVPTSKVYNYARVTFTYEEKRYTVRGKTEAEALTKKGVFLASLKRGEAGISGSMTVRAWAKVYLDTYVTPRVRDPGEVKGAKNSLTGKSAKMYSQKIDGYIAPAIGGMKMGDVKATHLQRIVNVEIGKSFSHVNKLMMVIQQLFRRSYIDRVILFDPSMDLSMPEVSKKTRRSLTPNELTVFRDVCAHHKHGLWAEFHLQFGLREGEVPPLQVKDLDFISHRLHISKAVESGTNEVKTPKTAAGIRAVPIPPEFEGRLKSYTAGKVAFDHLFPSESGGMMTQSGVTRRWRAFKRAMDIAMGAELDEHGKVRPETSKIAKDLSLHCLRHTFCTSLGEKGIDASVGRFITGHADVATLSNIYTHSNDAIIDMIADKLYGKNGAVKEPAEK